MDRNQPVPQQAESPPGLGTWKAECWGKGWEAVGIVGGQGLKKQRGLPSRAHEIRKERFAIRQSQGRLPAQALGDPAWGRYLGGKLNRITTLYTKKVPHCP